MAFFLNRTAALTLILLIGLMIGAEWMVRQPAVNAHLPPPSLGTPYRPAVEHFYELDVFVREHGGVDCIFLGNSIVHNALNPDVFEAGYTERTQEPLRCFNFGLSGLSASTAAPIAELLVKRYQPDILIYGVDGLEISDFFYPVQGDFPQSDWIEYHEGEFNPKGWLTDISYLYRYLNALPEVLTPNEEQDTISATSRESAGYQPATRFAASKEIPLFLSPKDFSLDEPYTLSEKQFEGFKRMAHLSQAVTLIVVEIPTAINQLYWQEHQSQSPLMQTARDYALSQGIPFWIIPQYNLISSSGWADLTHMYVTGSYQFSEWLGQQVGEAVQRGAWRDKTPPELLSAPPLPNLPVEYPPQYGLSDQNWQGYLLHRENFTLIEPGAVVFNPERGALDRDFLLASLGLYLEWAKGVNTSVRRTLFDFMAVIEHVSDALPAEVDQWRTTKQPQHLSEVDYLLYSSTWASWLTEEEIRVLTDHYEPVASWTHPSLPETFYLVRVIHP